MLEAGVEFSHYRVVEHIGRGGMADVWSARDIQLNRTVAIKTIARDLSLQDDPVRLFEGEARTIAALEHPHILPIYDFGSYDGQLYIVMRYVSGGSVEDWMEEGLMSIDDVLKLARMVGQALTYAHDSKVIHLDLKPSNILLDSYRSPYLADFGLAALVGPEGKAKNPGSGTLLYMAPEQMTSAELDHRADIYSYTIMLFHMLTGTLPFDAAAPLALRQLQQRAEIPNPKALRPQLPDVIHDVLRGGTEVDLRRRTPSVAAVYQAFEDALGAMSGVGGARVPRAVAASADMTTAAPGMTDLDALISRPADIDGGESPRILTDLEIDLSGIDQTIAGTEAMARREAEDIYKRARRAWARGQGRFLLGVTHFMLINDFYADATAHGLELDQAGLQLLLRGAIEYDYQIDFWWDKLDVDDRRWVMLHAVLSENATARIRALERLTNLPDTSPPQIPKLVAQALAKENNRDAKLAALRALECHATTYRRATEEIAALNAAVVSASGANAPSADAAVR
jgi:hypothetical protein